MKKKIGKKHVISKKKVAKNTIKGKLQKGIIKQYLKPRSGCRVTFRLPKKAAPGARCVAVVGSFNNWDKDAMPMKRLKNGDFTITVGLESDKEYRYRYLIDGTCWENDWCADRYEPNPYGCDDSVVVV